ALLRLPLGVVVTHRIDQLLHEAGREVDPRHDDARHLLVLDLVVDPGEGDGELVVGVADVGEVGVDARHDLRGEVDVQMALAGWVESAHIASVEVAGPGFLNLRLTPGWYRAALERILAEDGRYGSGAAAAAQRIQVEYVSGNPTGPVTVATARNAAYGDSLA